MAGVTGANSIEVPNWALGLTGTWDYTLCSISSFRIPSKGLTLKYHTTQACPVPGRGISAGWKRQRTTSSSQDQMQERPSTWIDGMPSSQACLTGAASAHSSASARFERRVLGILRLIYLWINAHIVVFLYGLHKHQSLESQSSGKPKIWYLNPSCVTADLFTVKCSEWQNSLRSTLRVWQ